MHWYSWIAFHVRKRSVMKILQSLWHAPQSSQSDLCQIRNGLIRAKLNSDFIHLLKFHLNLICVCDMMDGLQNVSSSLSIVPIAVCIIGTHGRCRQHWNRWKWLFSLVGVIATCLHMFQGYLIWTILMSLTGFGFVTLSPCVVFVICLVEVGAKIG